MNEQAFIETLARYVPENSMDPLMALFRNYPAHLRITRKRTSKHGDYRPPATAGQPHRISVNGNLGKHEFLLTLLHEMAHRICHELHTGRIKPHGKEWKSVFYKISRVFFERNVWPQELLPALNDYFKNPRASVQGHRALFRAFHRLKERDTLLLDDLKENEVFALENGRVFKKGAKRRTRYLCRDLKTKRAYLIHELAKVRLLENTDNS